MPQSSLWRSDYAGIQSLPPELLYSIFENLDKLSLRSCLFVCHKWYPVSERLLYKNPVLSSKSVVEGFVQAVCEKGMSAMVKGLHIRGKVDNSSKMRTEWLLQLPNLLPVFPNLRSIKFSHIEGVALDDSFWGYLASLQQVTELDLKRCRFARYNDVRRMIFSVPNLTALSLTHVRWEDSLGEEEYEPPVPHQRVPPVRRLELTNNRDVAAVLRLVRVLSTVRELSLRVFACELPSIADYLSHGPDSLRSLTLSPAVNTGDLEWTKFITDYGVLRRHKELEMLRLPLSNIDDTGMRWVNSMLKAVETHPLRWITLEFTLGWRTLNKGWEETFQRLNGNWERTLERVMLTHYPSEIAVKDIAPLFVPWMPRLVERGLLEVNIGVSDTDD